MDKILKVIVLGVLLLLDIAITFFVLLNEQGTLNYLVLIGCFLILFILIINLYLLFVEKQIKEKLRAMEYILQELKSLRGNSNQTNSEEYDLENER